MCSCVSMYVTIFVSESMSVSVSVYICDCVCVRVWSNVCVRVLVRTCARVHPAGHRQKLRKGPAYAPARSRREAQNRDARRARRGKFSQDAWASRCSRAKGTGRHSGFEWHHGTHGPARFHWIHRSERFRWASWPSRADGRHGPSWSRRRAGPARSRRWPWCERFYWPGWCCRPKRGDWYQGHQRVARTGRINKGGLSSSPALPTLVSFFIFHFVPSPLVLPRFFPPSSTLPPSTVQ